MVGVRPNPSRASKWELMVPSEHGARRVRGLGGQLPRQLRGPAGLAADVVPMIAAVDAHYRRDSACAACVTFEAWTDATPARELATLVHGVGAYVSGQLWRRELPCLLAVLSLLETAPTTVVIDGYVWLDDSGRKGLGAHLHDALEQRVAVVGVAKRAFRGSAHAVAVRRGDSRRPLYVTSQGMPLAEAAFAIASMHGEHRTPALLRRVDRLARHGCA